MTIDEKLNLLIDKVRQINMECLNEVTSFKKEFKRFKEDIGNSLEMCSSKISDCEAHIEESTKTIKVCERNIEN